MIVFDFCRVLQIEFLRFIRVRYAPLVSYSLPEFVVMQYGLYMFIFIIIIVNLIYPFLIDIAVFIFHKRSNIQQPNY